MNELRKRRGAVTIEMTLVGIPLIFVLITTFELSRGMWMYHTLAHAVREGVRVAIVHGKNCVPNPPSMTNSCTRTIGDIAGKIQYAGVGLDEETTTLQFVAVGSSAVVCTLKTCLTNATVWPPDGGNTRGQIVEIDISTPFHSALAGFWPGTSPVSFGVTNFGASSSDKIQF